MSVPLGLRLCFPAALTERVGAQVPGVTEGDDEVSGVSMVLLLLFGPLFDRGGPWSSSSSSCRGRLEVILTQDASGYR